MVHGSRFQLGVIGDFQMPIFRFGFVIVVIGGAATTKMLTREIRFVNYALVNSFRKLKPQKCVICVEEMPCLEQ